MKKTFPLRVPGKADARVLDAIKHDVRRYVKRERRKLLPEGFDIWLFHCKAGPDAATATTVDLKAVSAALDALAQAGNEHVYVEVIAAAGHQVPGVAPVIPAP